MPVARDEVDVRVAVRGVHDKLLRACRVMPDARIDKENADDATHPAHQRRIAAHTGIIAQEAQGQDEQHALPPGERHDRDRRGQLLHQPDRAVHHREQPVEQPCHSYRQPRHARHQQQAHRPVQHKRGSRYGHEIGQQEIVRECLEVIQGQRHRAHLGGHRHGKQAPQPLGRTVAGRKQTVQPGLQVHDGRHGGITELEAYVEQQVRVNQQHEECRHGQRVIDR